MKINNHEFKVNNNMKTKTLILVLICVFLMSLVMCCHPSCTDLSAQTQTADDMLSEWFINKIKIIEIDSCEYLWGEWGGGTVLAHKGNCKYCAERARRSLK